MSQYCAMGSRDVANQRVYSANTAAVVFSAQHLIAHRVFKSTVTHHAARQPFRVGTVFLRQADERLLLLLYAVKPGKQLLCFLCAES